MSRSLGAAASRGVRVLPSGDGRYNSRLQPTEIAPARASDLIEIELAGGYRVRIGSGVKASFDPGDLPAGLFVAVRVAPELGVFRL